MYKKNLAYQLERSVDTENPDELAKHNDLMHRYYMALFGTDRQLLVMILKEMMVEFKRRNQKND